MQPAELERLARFDGLAAAALEAVKELMQPRSLAGGRRIGRQVEPGARLVGAGDGLARGRLPAARADLEEVAAALPGARVELKPGAVAIHTRGVDSAVAAAALAAAMAVSSRHTGVHVIPGKQVVELTVVETDKGQALRAIANARSVEATAYFGDDVTDERAFAALDPRSGDVMVKVGQGNTPAEPRRV